MDDKTNARSAAALRERVATSLKFTIDTELAGRALLAPPPPGYSRVGHSKTTAPRAEAAAIDDPLVARLVQRLASAECIQESLQHR